MHPHHHHHHHHEDFEGNVAWGPGWRRQGARAMRGRGPVWFEPPWAGEGGPGEGFGPVPPPWARAARRGWGGGRARKGDVRAATLVLLSERPMHGYEVITEISRRTDGFWEPSPGSIYPTLQMLEDEGLVQAETSPSGSRRQFSLTEEGRRVAAELAAGPAPWEQFVPGPAGPGRALRHAARNLFAAVRQVAMTGGARERDEVVRILDEARRQVYALLASQQAPAGPEGTAPREPGPPPSAGA
jgi:DNA-binding PadR family transcriptional regulator